MDVLTEVLSEADRHDPVWLRMEAFLNTRKAKLTKKLVSANDEEVRGRIKELEFLLTPPAEPHTAL